MQKKIFAVFAVISGIIAGLLGGSNTYATSGNTATISDGDWNICVSATSYAGSSFVATISGTGFDTQLTFDDFETETCKEITLATGNDNTVTMNSPMGVSGMSYEVDTVNNKVTFAYSSLTNKYINSYGSFDSVIGATSTRIMFNANGGEGTIAEMDNVDISTSITLPESTMTRAGFKFAGWNTKADGTGTAYENGETINLQTNGEVIMFAQWREVVGAYLKTGKEVNAAIKSLARGASTRYDTYNDTIEGLSFVDELPDTIDLDETPKVNIALANSVPVYAYKATDDDYYIYTEADVMYANSDSSYMFNKMAALASIIFSESFNTSNVTNMEYMFSGEYRSGTISSLTSLTLPDSFDTSKVTNMSYMFRYATSLTSLTLPESFNTSNVIRMEYMFSNMSSLTSLTFPSNFNTSNVTNMQCMFASMSSLTSLTLPESFDTSNVTKMGGMFSNTSKLVTLNFSDNFNTSNVTSMNSMFSGASKLAALTFPGGFDTSSVIDMCYMFKGMSALASLTLPATFNTSNVTKMCYMFSDDSALTTLIFPTNGFNTINVTTMEYMFSGTKIISLVLPDSFNTSNVTNMQRMFASMKSLTSLVLPTTFNTLNVTTMSGMFSYASSLTSLTLPDSFNTSNVTMMNGMFSNMSSLTSLTFPSNFNTSNVTNMQNMFDSTSALTSLSLPDTFNTSNVTNMYEMFYRMSALTSLSLPDTFNTSNVTNMYYMFYGMSALTSLTLPNSFNTSNVTNMEGMFSGMRALTSLMLPDSFDTSKVTIMKQMFSATESLITLTLPESFNTSRVINMQQMFYYNGLHDLRYLNLPDAFVIGQSTLTSNMFDGNSTTTLCAIDAKARSLWPGELCALASLDTGTNVNAAIKTLANGTAMNYGDQDTAIKTLQFVDELPTSIDPDTTLKVNIALSDSEPVYVYQATADDYYIYTAAKKIFANANSSAMFSGLSELTSLSFPNYFLTMNVTDMSSMFADSSSLTSITFTNSFKTSNVTNMSNMFNGMTSLTSLTLPNVFVIGQSTTTTDIFASISSTAVLYAADATAQSLWPGVSGNN